MNPPLSRRTKLLYGSGDLGFSLTMTIIGAYFAIFLTDIVGLAPGAVGTAIFIGSTWDYLNDPIAGYISDRTRTRWGRRRPFLLFGALPFGIVFALLWLRPPLATALQLTVYYALAYVLFDTVASIVYMPYFALTPELTADYDERTSLTSYRMFFSILGSLVAFTVPLFIIPSFVPASAPRVLLMGLVFAVAGALPLVLVFFGTRERAEYMRREKPQFWKALRATFSNKPSVYGLLIYLVTWISVGILQGTIIFYIKHVVRREAESELVMATIFITAIVALPLWNWAARRFGKRWAYVGGVAFWAVVQLALITLTPATELAIILALCVLAGVGVAAAHVLPWSMLPDAIEAGELATGQRNEGTYYSMVTLAHKVANSLVIPGTLWLLELTGYDGLAAQQPASALWGIRIVIGPLPALLLGIGILLALRYPLSREQYGKVVRELEERRKRGT